MGSQVRFGMKLCSECEEDRPITDFWRRRKSEDGLQGRCKFCMQKENDRYRIPRIATHRRRMAELKLSLGCIECGYREHSEALDWDHLPGGNKVRKVSYFVTSAGYSWRRIMQEVDKCELVCANCHRVRTAERRGDE